MALVSDEAVCVRVWDWSETSQTVSLFTREHGLVRAVAKGAKREHAQFSGGLEVLTRGHAVLALRPPDKAAASMATLTAWDLAEVVPAARKNLGAFYAGLAMLDLVQHALTEADPHPALYDALVRSMRELALEHGAEMGVLRCAWAALSETGHAPELHRDVRTGEKLAEAAVYACSPRLGGLMADDDAAHQDAGAAPVWRVRAETIGVIRRVAAEHAAGGTGDAGRTGEYVCSPETARRAAALLVQIYREVFSCDPAAIRAWLEGVPRAPGA